jgi:serine/threonine-protein kinase HipA
MGAIFDDLSANALSQADGVIDALPKAFPDQLVESVRAAIEVRTTILSNTKDDALS